MREYIFRGTSYEMKVHEIKDSGDSTILLQTIVEENETPEKKYRINLSAKHPTKQNFFEDAEARLDYCATTPPRYWFEWYEDPTPEEPAPEGPAPEDPAPEGGE